MAGILAGSNPKLSVTEKKLSNEKVSTDVKSRSQET